MMKKASLLLVFALVSVLMAGCFRVAPDFPASQDVFEAIYGSDTEQLRKLVDDGARVNGHRDFVSFPGVYGRNPTPLIEACGYYGSSEMVDILLSAGADVNEADNLTGLTPLLVILGTGRADRYETAKKFLAEGADPNAAGTSDTVLSLCVEAGGSDLEAEGNELFVYVAERISGAEPIPGGTVLHLAVKRNNPYLCAYILEHDLVDPGAVDSHGKTAYECAVELGLTDIAALIREKIAGTSPKT